jgi:PAS domain S-box-containing protein
MLNTAVQGRRRHTSIHGKFESRLGSDLAGGLVKAKALARTQPAARRTGPAPAPDEPDLQFLIDQVRGFATFRLDREGKVAAWNTGAERLAGYQARDIVGEDFSCLHVREDVEAGKHRRALAIAKRAGRYEGEVWRVRKDGSRFWARVVVTALRDAAGALVGYGEVTRDMSEQLHATEQLRKLNADLEHRVKARTAALSATLKEREVLLQEVHHRVKNNLQVIASLINMQARSLGEGRGSDALRECQARVQAIALVHDQLYRSPDYAQVPFSEYARSLAANVFQAAGASPDRLSLELAVAEVALAVDRAIPCGLILNELITNALKHAFPDGRPGTIRVELARAGADGFRLVVSDDGVGLPAELDVLRSSSLGLHLVRMLVKQLDATLEVETSRGTYFRLTVPGGR